MENYLYKRMGLKHYYIIERWWNDGDWRDKRSEVLVCEGAMDAKISLLNIFDVLEDFFVQEDGTENGHHPFINEKTEDYKVRFLRKSVEKVIELLNEYPDENIELVKVIKGKEIR